MSIKEATARIKINKLLEASGWRFFATGSGPANIQLETVSRQERQARKGIGKTDTQVSNFEYRMAKCVS